eukprot:6210159-Pleurochrysis_carterae.AAC.5
MQLDASFAGFSPLRGCMRQDLARFGGDAARGAKVRNDRRRRTHQVLHLALHSALDLDLDLDAV